MHSSLLSYTVLLTHANGRDNQTSLVLTDADNVIKLVDAVVTIKKIRNST